MKRYFEEMAQIHQTAYAGLVREEILKVSGLSEDTRFYDKVPAQQYKSHHMAFDVLPREHLAEELQKLFQTHWVIASLKNNKFYNLMLSNTFKWKFIRDQMSHRNWPLDGPVQNWAARELGHTDTSIAPHLRESTSPSQNPKCQNSSMSGGFISNLAKLWNDRFAPPPEYSNTWQMLPSNFPKPV